MKRLAKDKVMWAVSLGTLAGLFIILYTPLNAFLKFAPLTISQFLIVFAIAGVSVLWYELVKLIKKLKKSDQVSI